MNSEIIELTEERKKIEKRLEKLNKKDKVLNFFKHEIRSRGRRYSYDTPVISIVGAVVSVLCMLPLLIIPNVTTVMMWVWLGLSTLPYIASFPAYGLISDAALTTKTEIKTLSNKRQEIIKHLDCVRTGEQYVSSQPKKLAEEKCEDFVMELMRAGQQAQQERKESLLTKARLRHIDVDRIMQGPTAFDNKKEYKEAKNDFENFLEENNADIRLFKD